MISQTVAEPQAVQSLILAAPQPEVQGYVLTAAQSFPTAVVDQPPLATPVVTATVNGTSAETPTFLLTTSPLVTQDPSSEIGSTIQNVVVAQNVLLTAPQLQTQDLGHIQGIVASPATNDVINTPNAIIAAPNAVISQITENTALASEQPVAADALTSKQPSEDMQSSELFSVDNGGDEEVTAVAPTVIAAKESSIVVQTTPTSSTETTNDTEMLEVFCLFHTRLIPMHVSAK